MSLWMNFAGLFFSYANLQEPSLSTPATTLSPSRTIPCVSAPIPQYKSTTFAFFTVR